VHPLPVVAVRELLDDASRASSAFEAANGLVCPDGCGACCESPSIEATVLELLPLAAAAWDEGRADALLADLAGLDDPLRCVLYESAGRGPGFGRCRDYAHRPSVCRLFGAAAFRHGSGRLELVTCRVRREQDPVAIAHAEAHLAAGLDAPVFSDHGFRQSTLDPALGAERMPINDALARALDLVGLRRQLDDAR